MRIVVASAHGRFELAGWSPEQTILEVCRLNRIPANSVSLYVDRGGELELITGLLRPVADLIKEGESLLIRPDRNINYHEIIPDRIIADVAPGDVSEYAFPYDDRTHHFRGMTSEECVAYIHQQVKEAIVEHGQELLDATVVVGVSGGGDSNVLVGALVAAGVRDIRPVMMMGIPDWDKGRDRAETTCAAYGLQLQVIESAEVGRLLGASPGHDWVSGFESTYPDVDLEMLGTLAVRLTLSAVAREVGTKHVITGLNLEDILGEALMCVMEGRAPLPYPHRTVGDIDIFYPLYRCPKKIIDGCFPKFSLANYEDRYPSHMRGRALAYYLAQSMNGLIPGIEFDLLNGLQRIGRDGSASMHADPDLGFVVLRSVSAEAKSKWMSFLGR